MKCGKFLFEKAIYYELINYSSAFMANHGKVKLNKRSLGDFQASMVCKL